MNTLNISRNTVLGFQYGKTVFFGLKERRDYSSLTADLDIMIVLFWLKTRKFSFACMSGLIYSYMIKALGKRTLATHL
jgi:hypothetical protein